jgi:hypothetical protein
VETKGTHISAPVESMVAARQPKPSEGTGYHWTVSMIPGAGLFLEL